MARFRHGGIEAWSLGAMETCRPVELLAWKACRRGSMEVWRYGNLKDVWVCEGVEVWIRCEYF